MNPGSARIGLAYCRTWLGGFAVASSHRVADADEDVSVPAENLSPCLGQRGGALILDIWSFERLRRSERCGGPPSRCEATA